MSRLFAHSFMLIGVALISAMWAMPDPQFRYYGFSGCLSGLLAVFLLKRNQHREGK